MGLVMGGRGGLEEDVGVRVAAAASGEVGQLLCGGSLGGLMTAKEQLRQVVDVMGEEEAGRVLQLLSSQRVGGTDNGGPGIRELYHPTYYGAYVLDPDGNNVEAACHHPE